MKQKIASGGNSGARFWRKPVWASISVMVVCTLLLTLGMILATAPERYNLSVGDIAPKTITATKDVIDEVATTLRRDRAVEAVQPTYRVDEMALDRVLEQFDAIFQDFEIVRAYGEDIRSGTIRSAAGGDYTYNGTFLRADLDHAASLCTTIELSDWQLTILMKQSAGDLNGVYVNTRNILNKALESTIREGQLESAIANIQRQVIQYTSSDLCWNIAIPAVRMCLVPNMVIDQEATEANREAARHEVEPSMFKSGQNIVIAGERITSAQLSVLESLGLLEGNRSDVMMMVGIAVLSVLAMLAILFHVLQFEKDLMARPKNALILAVIFLLATGLSLLVAQINPYLAPVSMVPLLIASLLSPGLAVIGNILALVFAGVLTNTTTTTFTQQMLNMMIAGVLSAPIGIYVVRRKQNRASVLLAGLSMALVNLFGMISAGLLTNNELSVILDNALWSAGGNVLSAILCTGVQPMLEWMFDLVTPYKLLELANPNQPMLRRLLVETPGTYHHSILVANLAEAAAEAIGADPLLTRVGAYYHDIGKIRRPQFFKENQLSENPHDMTDPRVSAAIIAEHVTDGVQMARQEHLPEQVIDFITQHHGDTVITYFYHKMLNMEGGEGAQVEDFQYPGPKPRTAETAILMLADTAEAAVRAGGDQEPEAIEKRLRELVKEKIDSGQLNDSPLRFADVSKITRAFAQVLTGIYHKRIEYPKLDGVASLPPPRQPVIKIVEPAPESEAREAGEGATHEAEHES